MNQLCIIQVDKCTQLVFRSPYQRWKYENNYRKAEKDSKKRCDFCSNCVNHRIGNRNYYKSTEQGISGSAATDIRLSYVCDKWQP